MLHNAFNELRLDRIDDEVRRTGYAVAIWKNRDAKFICIFLTERIVLRWKVTDVYPIRKDRVIQVSAL